MRKGHGYIFNETEELRDQGDGESCEVCPVQKTHFPPTSTSIEFFALGCIETANLCADNLAYLFFFNSHF